MMTRTWVGAWATAITLTGIPPALGGEPGDIARRIEEIRQPESMRRWERIPWVTDLGEGQRAARREHRPIFLWVTGDDPLERC